MGDWSIGKNTLLLITPILISTYFRTSWRSIHKNLFANGLSRSRHFLKILTCSLFTFNLSFAKSLKPEKSFGEFECIFRNKCCSRLSQTLPS